MPSVFLGVYDTAAGELTYINGGHSPLPRLVTDRRNSPVKLLSDAHTLLLGVAERQATAPARLELRSGDTLMFVTDGIEEAQGVNGEMYGAERLDGFIDENRDRPPAELIRRLTEDVEELAHDAAPTDDRTLLAMRVR